MQVLTDALAARLPRETVRLNTRVETLSFFLPESNRWAIATKGGERIHADGVCIALPAYTAARLLRDVDGALAAELEAIPYASTATVNLAYRREQIPHPLDGFGFVVPFVERRRRWPALSAA